MTMCLLREPFDTLWREQDPFAAVETLQGQVYRELAARRTLSTNVAGEMFFVKIHRGVGWKEIFKNLLSLRLPVLGAKNEWQAIERLQTLGVKTMDWVAFGITGHNPAAQHSFIITRAIMPSVSLEDYCRDWARRPPPMAFKRNLITRVAQMARRMHQGGVNHRDFYLCHFLLGLQPEPQAQQFTLSLIDLHRAQVRDNTPPRWRNKDLAGLYFSALHIGLTRRDRLRFLQEYFDRPLRDILRDEAPAIRYLQQQSAALLRRYQRKYAPSAANE